MKKIVSFGIFAMSLSVGSWNIHASSTTGVISPLATASPIDSETKGVLKSLTPYGPYLLGPLAALCTVLLYLRK